MPEHPEPDSPERPARVTHAMEDYLKAAYRLEESGDPITTQRLADELGLSGPSVTNMVKRLNDLNLLVHRPYHGVQLTETGRQVALEVIRHHRLLELYLSQALGYDLDEVHQEAERLEHHMSEVLESRMERVLGFPLFDPHGDPIPSRDGNLPTLADVRLPDAAGGDFWTVTRVSDRDPATLRFLATVGVRPGVLLHVLPSPEVGDEIRVAIEGATHYVPLHVANAIRVEAWADTPEG